MAQMSLSVRLVTLLQEAQRSERVEVMEAEDRGADGGSPDLAISVFVKVAGWASCRR